MAVNGVYIVQGELNALVAQLRRGNGQKWQQNHNQTSSAEQDVLLRNFVDLRDVLCTVADLSDMAPSTFLTPFLEVIRSEHTSGLVTGQALSAIGKFLSYGLVHPESLTAPGAVQSIADSVNHTRFVGTDAGSDEVVLFRILQVLRALLLTPVGVLLSDESVCELLQSCFRICFEKRLSELLRRSAESCLTDMVQLLFTRLPTFVEDTKHPYVSRLKMRAEKKVQQKSQQESQQQQDRPQEQQQQQLSESETPKSTESTPSSDQNQSPYGLPCVCELLRFLISISNPEERQNTEEMLELGLNLLIVSLEAGADYLGQFAILLPLIKNELCRNLNFTLLHTKPSVFAATLRVGFLCFEALRTHLKLQLEYYLVRLKEIILADQATLAPNYGRGSAAGSAFFERKELALEALVELWRIPGLVTELYLNYDCDLYCSNLFEELTKLLSKNAFSGVGGGELTSAHVLSLDALLTVVDSIEVNCHYRMLNFKDRQQQQQRNTAAGGQRTEEGDKMTSSPSHMLPMASGITAGRLISSHVVLSSTNPITLSPNDSSAAIGQSESTNDDPADSVGVNSASSNLMLAGDAVRDDQQILLDVLRFPQLRPNRMPISTDLIFSHEDLIARKQKKRLLQTGTDLFNQSPSKGVIFLQEHGLLRTPLMLQDVVDWLKENPHLDKRKIAEYIVNRKNVKILEAFVKSFNFRGLRLDQALRLFLETFRLPGEAAEISMVIEHFSDHWHTINDHPFASADAAFTLAYAVIMLNVDQHNPLAKRQNQPMTVEAFKKNLSGVNGGGDFDQHLLEEIFKAIRQKEIIMPAEQTGAVRENYVWKLLLKRGHGPEGRFIHAPPGLYDHDLFQLVWGPTVAALSYVFDKTHDELVTAKCASGFRKCAAVAAHYAMSDVFDNLVVNLCKFSQILTAHSSNASLAAGGAASSMTSHSSLGHHAHGSAGALLLGLPDSVANDQLILEMADDPKAQCAAKCLFQLLRNYGDILRDGWRNVVECLLQLYRSDLLPPSLTQVEDFADPSGQINIRNRMKSKKSSSKNDQSSSGSGIFSSFYNYLGSSASTNDQEDGVTGPPLTPEERRLLKAARDTVAECKPEQLIGESKYLTGEALAEFLKALVVGGATLANLHHPGGGGGQSGAGSLDTTAFRNRGAVNIGAQITTPTLSEEVEAAVVFYLELIVGVCMENRDRLTPYWRTIRAHIFSLIIDYGENNRFLLERCIVAILRLTSRLLTRSVGGLGSTGESSSSAAIVDEIFNALGALLTTVRRQTFSALSKQIAGGLYEALRLNASNISAPEHWTVVMDLLEAAGAAVFAAESQENVRGAEVTTTGGDPQIQGTQRKRTAQQYKKRGLVQSDNEDSRGETDVDDNETSAAAVDRGYTSDTEVYAQQKQQSRGGGVGVAAVASDQSDSRASSGEWLYVTEKDVDQHHTLGSTASHVTPHDGHRRTSRPRVHDSSAYFKCCETLTFLIRSTNHVTPQNFDVFLRALRTLVDAGLDAGALRDVTAATSSTNRDKAAAVAASTTPSSGKKRHAGRKTGSNEKSEPGASGLSENLEQVALQLIDLIHTLHVDSAQIFANLYSNFENRSIDHESAGRIWTTAWRPLLQILSHICCDQRRRVRLAALTYLQRALLVPDLKILSVDQWEDCCCHVLFPLLSNLLYESRGHQQQQQKSAADRQDPSFLYAHPRFFHSGPSDPDSLAGLDEARVRAVTLTSKVFLQHLGPLSSGHQFVDLFCTILSFAQHYLRLDSADLQESVPESVKNMLLVIDTAKLFEQNYRLATLTRQKLAEFLPQLIDMVSLVDPTATVPHDPEHHDAIGQQQQQQQQHDGHHVIGQQHEGVVMIVPREDHVIGQRSRDDAVPDHPEGQQHQHHPHRMIIGPDGQVIVDPTSHSTNSNEMILAAAANQDRDESSVSSDSIGQQQQQQPEHGQHDEDRRPDTTDDHVSLESVVVL